MLISNDYKKRFWQKIINYGNLIGLIGGVLGILSTGFSINSILDTKHNKEIEGKIQQANDLFENSRIYDTIEKRKAHNLYLEVRKERPSAGYDKFLNAALNRMDILDTCDTFSKWYLLRAQELQNTTNVREKLNDFCK